MKILSERETKTYTWFLIAVAVFLVVTASLKLFGVLMETRVLGGTDPVLSFLTVRQITFLAAVLEGAVACALIRRHNTLWAPWLVLWLVGVFVSYRVGRWAMGFGEYCNCLGHIFGWIPGFEVWADRIAGLSLILMAAGSLWILVRTCSRPTAISSSQALGRSISHCFLGFGLAWCSVVGHLHGAHSLSLSGTRSEALFTVFSWVPARCVHLALVVIEVGPPGQGQANQTRI